ncbi:MAG TPA: class I SAM-dependent methyltransferase [Gemmatimonadales bacterium]|jgi:S-adenosylmethionine-dependent methyltransferase
MNVLAKYLRKNPTIRAAVKQMLYPIPRHLARNQVKVSNAGRSAIEQSVRHHYHSGWRSERNYSAAMYREDLENHVLGRLESDRRLVIPWLDKAQALKGSHILEVGCGTGSSTISLVEQGASVVGIDLDEPALVVARERCRVYEMQADLYTMNACEMAEQFRGEWFDSIIFFASLEHMTIAERLTALRAAWTMLPIEGHLVIVETPNRLWYRDGHTADLPFFHWLPNELAFRYSQLSPRENFRELYRTYDARSKEHFLRQGRGVSFHEFDLAIKPAKDLKIVSSLSTFQGMMYKPQRSLLDRRYKSMLRRIYPEIHEGFCDDALFLIIEKDEATAKLPRSLPNLQSPAEITSLSGSAGRNQPQPAPR